MMKCTACGKGLLKPAYLDDLFACHTCNHCFGNWIMLNDYLQWLENSPLVEPAGELMVTALDSKHVLICPKTGTMMLKYRISGRTEHRLDLSSDIGGIWMDKGEWNLLKKEGLARSLNQIFTAPWQKKIKEEKTAEVLSARYEEKFGLNGYKQVKEMRSWLDDQDHRLEMLAYLIADDPYSTNR